MRTITLELLRHGPPHNQLLSPLTPYLALCENHAPVTLHVPFEHNQFMHRLSALAYQEQDRQRHFQIHDTGLELGRLLCAIPGLTAELSREHGDDRHGVTHLRLVLSASELALLPFELALAGNGLPGAGQPMLLQSELPLCITREVRRVSISRQHWACDPRVLFVCASPRGLPEVPLQAHLLALRKAIEPWVPYHEPHNEAARAEAIDKRLRVLPHASIEEIEDACAEGGYTHVHVLAHGVAHASGYDTRFGLALHRDDDPDGACDVVGGDRLATALRAMQQPGLDDLACPLVVTLASCYGGNVGSVVGAGASVAHALQEAGIPLVVAAQFPLSFGGSVELVERLYEGLLWGLDPRELLMDLRRRLHVLRPDNHDWASLMAYAALPQGFEGQIHEARVKAARHAIDNAMAYADKATWRMLKPGPDKPDPYGAPGFNAQGAQSDSERVLVQAHERILFAKGKLKALVTEVPPAMRAEVWGLLASADKRHAEVIYWSRHAHAGWQAEVRKLLRSSKQAYWKTYRSTSDMSWAIVQLVTVSRVLQEFGAGQNDRDMPAAAMGGREGRDLRELWRVAFTLSLNDLDAEPERVGWALGNLIELALLAQLLDISPAHDQEPWPARAVRWVDRLLASRTSDFQIYSTRRQLLRLSSFYPRIAPRMHTIAAQADELIDRLAEDSGLV